MKERVSLLQFPCSYPLKVLGQNTNAFHAMVSAIIEKYVAEGTEITYLTRASSGDKYLSITATFIAQSQEQLSAIYEELNQHELVLITPDTISYKRYLVFGAIREIPLTGGVDVASSERARTLISLGILFILPALFFWAVIFSIVYFGVIILITYILILIMAGLFRIESTLLKLIKLCIFASTPFILLQLVLMPFFRIFVLPLAAYWILVFIVIFLWHDDKVKGRGGGYVTFGHSEKKDIFGGGDSGSRSKRKVDVKDKYDVDEDGNLKSSSRRHKSVDEDNEDYVELK